MDGRRGVTFIPTRGHIRRECRAIQESWTEEERYARAGLIFWKEREVYYGDPATIGVASGRQRTENNDD